MAGPFQARGAAHATGRIWVFRSIAQTCRADAVNIESLTGPRAFIVIARVPPLTEAALSFGAG